jgi:putative acetyltransferase
MVVVQVGPVRAGEPEVVELLAELTAALAGAGYTADQTFGYSAEQLDAAEVHLVGACVGKRLTGIGGVELQAGGLAELKRFYVVPGYRGQGIADAILAALIRHALTCGARVLRLETGNRQQAAVAFYRRHGFAEVPRFGAYVDSATSVCMQLPVTAD